MSAAASVLARRHLSVHRTISSIRSVRKQMSPVLSVGYVPTMGALHDGHLSLVREAREKNDVVVTSIFVNPTQFGEGEDLDKYPRQLEQDCKCLAELGVDHLFTPDSSSMYSKNYLTYVDPTGFDDLPEGTSRPGHFRGVATIVTKLFNIIQPTNAYFGQKDAAQCCLVKRVVDDLNMEVNIVVMDTVREEDGLAMSSRNAYLTPDERQAAPIVYKSLCAAKDHYQSALELGKLPISAESLSSVVEKTLKSEKLVSEVQYITVDDRETMRPALSVGSDGAVISLACVVGSVRLIDNVIL